MTESLFFLSTNSGLLLFPQKHFHQKRARLTESWDYTQIDALVRNFGLVRVAQRQNG
jgi:hypothetical protein